MVGWPARVAFGLGFIKGRGRRIAAVWPAPCLPPTVYCLLEEVVAEIRALPPNPAAVRPATASLADLLENAPEDLSFDLARWTRQWQAIEAEMKSRDRADDIAEGRG